MILFLFFFIQLTTEGRVFHNDAPLAEVTIFSATNTRLASTNKSGEFTLPSLKSDAFPIRFEKSGFQTIYISAEHLQNDLRVQMVKERLNSSAVVDVFATQSLLEQNKRSLPLSLRKLEKPPHQQLGIKSALEQHASITVQESSGAGSAPIINGFRSNKLLYAVNGIRFNNAFFKSGNTPYLSLINPIYFQDISLADGGVSLLYGSDAIGAALDYRHAAPRGNADIYTGFHSGDRSFYFGGVGSATHEKFTHNYGIYFAKGGNRVAGENGNSALSFNENMATVYQQRNFDYDLVYAAENSEHRLGFHIGRQDDAEDFFRQEFKDADLYKYKPLQFLQVYQSNTFRLGETELIGTIYYQNFREYKHEFKSNERHYNDEISTFGASLLAQRNLSKTTLTYGLDAIAEESNTHATKGGVPEVSKYPSGAEQVQTGVFAAASYSASHFRWLGGLRYSHTSSHIPRQETASPIQEAFRPFSEDFSKLTYSLGMTYFNAAHQINVLNYSGFRAPNFDDLSKTGEQAGDVFSIPNHALAPEKSNTIRLEYIGTASRWSLRGAVFYTSLSNLIEDTQATFLGDSSVVVDGKTFGFEHNANISSAYLAGFSAQIAYESDRYSAAVAAAFQQGENTDTSEPLSKIPPLNLTFSAHAKITKEFTAGAKYRYMAKQQRLSASDIKDERITSGGTPAFYTLSASATYVLGNYTFSANFVNLTDQRYRVHASALNGYGRSIELAIKAEF